MVAFTELDLQSWSGRKRIKDATPTWPATDFADGARGVPLGAAWACVYVKHVPENGGMAVKM